MNSFFDSIGCPKNRECPNDKTCSVCKSDYFSEILNKLKNCQNCEYGDRFANVDPCKECHTESMFINWRMEIKK